MYINDLTTTVQMYKYIDDSTIFEICEFGGTSVIQESVDIATMWTIRNEMIINSEKMKKMVICYAHGANTINRVPCIEVNGMVVERVEYVKLLGVTLSNDLTWNRHVDTMVQKVSKRIFLLYQLKRAGIRQADMVTIYLTVVRPIVEYACPVWHTNLPTYLSDSIEIIQKRALRGIFPGMSYIDILNHIDITTLKERRDFICRRYFINMQKESHKLHYLLPDERNAQYNLRPGNRYPLPVTRTNRYRNSLIPWGLYNWQ